MVTVFNIPGVHQAASKPWAVLATMATLERMVPQALWEPEAKALMRQVAGKFNFQPTIADWLVDQGVRSLTDFQDLVTTKEGIGTEIIDKMTEETVWAGSRMVQTARVRMAWASTFAAAASERKKAELVETGQEVLSAPELRNLEQRWLMRYKVTPEAGECPSDYVVTTAVRQRCAAAESRSRTCCR